MQFVMKRITVSNGHIQLMFTFSDLGRRGWCRFLTYCVWVWALWTNCFEEITYNLACSYIQRTYHCWPILGWIFASFNLKVVTHRGRDKMAVIIQTTFLNAFSWMNVYKFRLSFQLNLFPKAQLIIFQHWFRYWLVAWTALSHYLNQCWLVNWRIYASLGLNELRYPPYKVLHQRSQAWHHM